MEVENILSREGEALRVYVFFFKSVVQAVMLFVTETWLVIPFMVQVLSGFQEQVLRRLAGRLPRRRTDGKWEYTSSAVAREEAVFEAME